MIFDTMFIMDVIMLNKPLSLDLNALSKFCTDATIWSVSFFKNCYNKKKHGKINKASFNVCMLLTLQIIDVGSVCHLLLLLF